MWCNGTRLKMLSKESIYNCSAEVDDCCVVIESNKNFCTVYFERAKEFCHCRISNKLLSHFEEVQHTKESELLYSAIRQVIYG